MKGMMMAGMSLMISMAMLMNKYMKGYGGGGGGGGGGNTSRIFVVVDYYEYRMNTSILIHLVTCRSIQRNCPLNES